MESIDTKLKTKLTNTLPAVALGSHGADYSRTHYHIDLDPQFTLADIKRPNFWAHHAQKLKRGDIVDILSRDDSFDVQMRVTGVGVGFVEMRVLREWVRGSQTEQAPEEAADLPDEPENYKVKWAGPKALWRVITIDPSQTVSEGHASKEVALQAAISHSAAANKVAA